MTINPPEPTDRDWRDPSQPRNPEDDVIVEGWRRKLDGTWEKIEIPTQEEPDNAGNPPMQATD